MLACLFCFSPCKCNILNNGELVLIITNLQSSHSELSLRYHIGLCLLLLSLLGYCDLFSILFTAKKHCLFFVCVVHAFINI